MVVACVARRFGTTRSVVHVRCERVTAAGVCCLVVDRAAVTLVSEVEQPKLFSIILGEGLFNDAVAIILY